MFYNFEKVNYKDGKSGGKVLGTYEEVVNLIQSKFRDGFILVTSVALDDCVALVFEGDYVKSNKDPSNIASDALFDVIGKVGITDHPRHVTFSYHN